MNTKNHPSPFDGYTKALPNEPFFSLLARDKSAPDAIRDWASKRQATSTDIAADEPQILDALAIADRMEQWRKQNDGAWETVKPDNSLSQLLMRRLEREHGSSDPDAGANVAITTAALKAVFRVEAFGKDIFADFPQRPHPDWSPANYDAFASTCRAVDAVSGEGQTVFRSDAPHLIEGQVDIEAPTPTAYLVGSGAESYVLRDAAAAEQGAKLTGSLVTPLYAGSPWAFVRTPALENYTPSRTQEPTDDEPVAVRVEDVEPARGEREPEQLELVNQRQDADA